MEVIGTYARTIFRNIHNGYTVFIFDTNNGDAPRTSRGDARCEGVIPVFPTGMPLKLVGEVSEYNGEPVLAINEAIPYTDNEAIAKAYLASAKFKGVGEKTAQAIIDAVGADIFSILSHDNPAQFLADSVKGVSYERAYTIVLALQGDTCTKEVFDYIYRFGGGYHHAERLVSAYKLNALTELKTHPYIAGHDVGGLNFGICDAIAANEGYTPYGEERICLMSALALQRATQRTGSTYATFSETAKEVKEMVTLTIWCDYNIPKGVIMRGLYNNRNIIIEADSKEPRFYCKKIYEAETSIASHVKRLRTAHTQLPKCEAIDVALIEQEVGIKYSTKQKEAFEIIKSTGVKILTGGPGTGKTTVVNGLIRLFRKAYPRATITLCAPTGRAAQRLSEVTGEPAQTIHRLLDVKPAPDGELSFKSQRDPLPSNLLIVDEMSMVDTELFAMLMGAVKPHTTVLLCGDKDQLPSVGVGNVLRDLITSGVCEMTALTTAYRQSELSLIASNAILCNKGKTELAEGRDFVIVRAKTETEIVKHIRNIAKARFNPSLPYSLQILSSTKQGNAGTVNINRVLQQDLNTNPSAISYGDYEYRTGDKVIFNKNNYEAGYLNGDVGVITSITSNSITIQLPDNELTVTKAALADLALAYAVTIHKSQGSEYDTVVVVLPQAPRIMLQRNLIYTAITRAKKQVILITQDNAMETAIETNSVPNRRTYLTSRLTCNTQQEIITHVP